MVGYGPPYQRADVRPLLCGYPLQFLVVSTGEDYPNGDLSSSIWFKRIHHYLSAKIVTILRLDSATVKEILSPNYYHAHIESTSKLLGTEERTMTEPT